MERSSSWRGWSENISSLSANEAATWLQVRKFERNVRKLAAKVRT